MTKLKFRDINYHQKTRIILEHIQEITDNSPIPLTVRHIHYRLVAKGIIKNTQKEYQRLSRIITDGRYTGVIDWDKIEDGTRGASKTRDYENITDAIQSLFKRYRRNRWEDSPYYIEVWVEKRGMQSIFSAVTDEYDVFLNIGGGFNSASSIWEAVRRFYFKRDKDIRVLYFGDLDPSGYFMHSDIEKRINEMGDNMGFNISIERALINFEHIEKYNLPPAFDVKVIRQDGRTVNKLQEDPRAMNFIKKHGDLFQVEMEAMEIPIILEHVRGAIEKYYDKNQADDIIALEQNEIKDVRERLKIT